MIAQNSVSSYAENLYKQETGNSTKWYDIYDIEVTVDKRHKGSKYSSYLWINSDGTVMEKPIVYSNDKVVVGRRGGVFYFGFTPLVNMPIDTESPISEEYQDGKCFFGPIWIGQATADASTAPVTRNTWYNLKITGIKLPGEPHAPKIDNTGTTPLVPPTNVAITLTVQPWNFIDREITLQ